MPSSSAAVDKTKAPSSSRIEQFPPNDPKGYIYGAQVEFIYAYQMLEVLMRLAAEGEHAEMLPVEGLYGLFCAIQGHVCAGSEGLQRWQQQYAVQATAQGACSTP